MLRKADKNISRKKRHLRVRKNISGTATKPRLNVFRSLNNMYVQVIDDVNGVNLNKERKKKKEVKEAVKYGGNIEASKAVGAVIAKRAIEKGIKQVVFDRGGYLYHGRVAALAEAAREAGLEF